MAKKRKIIEDKIENDIDIIEEYETQIIINNISKEKVCRVLWIRDTKFAISFEDFGIEIKIDNSIDKSKIKDFITVKYEGTIGTPLFKVYPIYE